MDQPTIHHREATFHDDWALHTPVQDVLVNESFHAPTALENRFILGKMGPLRGKRILDVGAGLGESSTYFALQGAQVMMIDISPKMLERAQEVGRRFGVNLEARIAEGEKLPVDSGAFDFLYIANTIHHVSGRAALFEEMRRVLKPGGWFFSVDPVAYNPAINVYRKMATGVRTKDETPLRRGDVALARRYFENVECRMFWIAALALFFKYYLVDRVHPNADRYWKRILRETPETLAWWRPLLALDTILTRIPGLRWWAWNVVLCGHKHAPGAPGDPLVDSGRSPA
jgi:SAM-dependent methyltransferase